MSAFQVRGECANSAAAQAAVVAAGKPADKRI
jgi:hypothetical protein